MQTFSLLTLAGDGDTWGLTVSGSSADTQLRELRQVEVFDGFVRALPLHAHWLDGEPLGEVYPMAGIVDMYRRFVVDGAPVVTGLLAVGDAWACTNPSAGRGLSLGLVHATLLRDVLEVTGPDPAAQAMAWDTVTERELTPFFEAQAASDHERRAEMEAYREGREVPAQDVRLARLWTAAGRSADAFRGLMDEVGCLAHRHEVLARPEVVAAMNAFGSDVRRPFPGPARPELERLLGA
jgi:flavin-dependent dehydrogenase